MNIKLINRQNLIRRLRLASVSFALLLLPIEAWAEDYNLCVGETQVTSENASNIFAGDEVNDGKVSFDALTNTLTMNGAEIEGDISAQLAALTIHLTGDNSLKRIQGDEEGSLTFTGTGTLSLDNGDGVIRDFSGVDFGNFNLLSNSSPGGVHWDEETM